MIEENTLYDANEAARRISANTSRAVNVWQTGATRFVVAYDDATVKSNLLCSVFQKGKSVSR
jgi:hypothetical protein